MSVQAGRGGSRTSFSVDLDDGRHREVIAGARAAWSFRPHYHQGDELVRIVAGRARLRMGGIVRIVTAGETLSIPARTVHRFEPVDAQGWAFRSTFVRSAYEAGIGAGLAAKAAGLLRQRRTLRTDIGRIARACAVSEQHLARRFRRETGTSLHGFHVLMALHDAKTLLKQGVSIVEAALGAGFYDQAHLTREFVKTLGMTPGAFRRGWLAAPRAGAAA